MVLRPVSIHGHLQADSIVFILFQSGDDDGKKKDKNERRYKQ